MCSPEMALWGLFASSLRRDVSFQLSPKVGCGFRRSGFAPAWRMLLAIPWRRRCRGLLVVYIRLHGGSLSLAALPLLVFLVGVSWARRRAVSGSCGTSSGRTEESREERSFTFKLKRPLIREDLKVIQYQSQEADNTFITSDGTSPYNSTRKWAVKRHYCENNN